MKIRFTTAPNHNHEPNCFHVKWSHPKDIARVPFSDKHIVLKNHFLQWHLEASMGWRNASSSQKKHDMILPAWPATPLPHWIDKKPRFLLDQVGRVTRVSLCPLADKQNMFFFPTKRGSTYFFGLHSQQGLFYSNIIWCNMVYCSM